MQPKWAETINKQKVAEQNIPNSLFAQRLLSIGILTIPCKEDKKPFGSWSNVAPSNVNEEYWSKFDNSKFPSIGIIGGAKSGGLECIDVDCKYDLDGTLWSSLVDAIYNFDYELYGKLTIATTPSGGYHILFRSTTCGRNRKLAERMMTEQEVEESGESNVGTRVLIETRGEGGYFLGYPSSGYNFIQNNYSAIPFLVKDERDGLIHLCESLNQIDNKRSSKAVSFDLGTIPTTDGASHYVKIANSHKSKYIITVWDDFNAKVDPVQMLESVGWAVIKKVPNPQNGEMVTYLSRPGKQHGEFGATFNHVPNKLWVFSTSTPFPSEKPLSAFDIFVYQNRLSVAQAIETLEGQGYGVRVSKQKQSIAQETNFTDATELSSEPINKSIITDVKLDDVLEEKIKNNTKLIKGRDISLWWKVTVVQKKDESIEKKLIISHIQLIEWLSEKGFRKMKNQGVYDYVKISGNIVEMTDKVKIGKYIADWIYTLPEQFDYITKYELLECYTKQTASLLHDLKLGLLREFDSELVAKDSATKTYIQYSNGVLEITKNEIKLVPLKEFTKYIWSETIKQFEYKVVSIDEIDNHNFSRFLYNISNKSLERYKGLLAIIGYLINRYKNPSTPVSVILCDSKVSDRSEGGTGKGILVSAIGHVRNVVYEDGKSYNEKSKSEFRFQRVKATTDILHISDVEKGFDFERLFSIITEGMPINVKFRNEEWMPYEDSPKIVISTNFSVGGKGSSHERRKIEFELADFYNSRYKPKDEFGQDFFADWDTESWNVFYNIMARCVQVFLMDGLPTIEGINLDQRKFKDETSAEFFTWFLSKYGTREEVAIRGVKDGDQTELFSRIFTEYLGYSGLERTEVRPVRFMKMMYSGCAYIGADIEELSMNGFNSNAKERYLKISTRKAGNTPKNVELPPSIHIEHGDTNKSSN